MLSRDMENAKNTEYAYRVSCIGRNLYLKKGNCRQPVRPKDFAIPNAVSDTREEKLGLSFVPR